MNRPTKLFHASPLTNLLELKPQNKYPRYADETNLIFATPHQALAAMFLSPRTIDTEIAVYGDRHVIFINSDKESYAQQDKGGAIYLLPVDTFETDNVHGMGEMEWYSRTAVKPTNKTVYQTSIEAMDAFGVTRFYVNDDTFQKIRLDPANALKLVE